MTNEDMFMELTSPDHLTDLIQLMNAVCNPCSPYVQEYVKATQVTRAKANSNKTNEYVYVCCLPTQPYACWLLSSCVVM